jgi:hypothetical protein
MIAQTFYFVKYLLAIENINEKKGRAGESAARAGRRGEGGDGRRRMLLDPLPRRW